jgi:hypothetical protein
MNFWKKITFIPFQVVQHAYKMQDLLVAISIAAAEQNEARQKQDAKATAAAKASPDKYSDVKSDDEKRESDFQALLHDILDNEKFMEYAEIVFGFIVSHGDMFVKPYILQLYCETYNSWSCQVSVNAGKMDAKDQPIKEELVRCFLTLRIPMPVTDSNNPFTCLSKSLAPSNPFLFDRGIQLSPPTN